MSRPESYREQKACANCKHVMTISEGAIIQGASFRRAFCGKDGRGTVNDTVSPSGICDEWEGEESCLRCGKEVHNTLYCSIACEEGDGDE